MNGEEGFTLVELLAAMVAGTLLLASLAWYTVALGRDLRRDAGASDIAAISSFAPILSEMIERSLPVHDGGGRFEGDDRHLLLRVPPPEVLATAGPLDLRLDVHRQTDGVALDLVATAQSATPLTSRLLAGLKDIRFSYVARERVGELPRLITIHFISKDGSVRRLAIEPRLSAGAACVFDPISMTCRP